MAKQACITFPIHRLISRNRYYHNYSMPGVGAKTWPAVDRTLLSDSDAAVSFLLPYDLGAAGVIIWGPPEDGSRHGLPCPVCEPAANEFWD